MTHLQRYFRHNGSVANNKSVRLSLATAQTFVPISSRELYKRSRFCVSLKMNVFNNVVRGIFGPSRVREATDGWRKLHTTELHNLYF
jgi:hypothetical protein